MGRAQNEQNGEQTGGAGERDPGGGEDGLCLCISKTEQAPRMSATAFTLFPWKMKFPLRGGTVGRKVTTSATRLFLESVCSEPLCSRTLRALQGSRHTAAGRCGEIVPVGSCPRNAGAPGRTGSVTLSPFISPFAPQFPQPMPTPTAGLFHSSPSGCCNN